MKLRYIYLRLRYGIKDSMWHRFVDDTYYINYFLSKRVRKLKFETSLPYNYLQINLMPIEQIGKQVELCAENVIEVSIPFDKTQYEQERDKPNCAYYLGKVREGIVLLDKHTPLPVEGIFGIIDDFVAGGCVTEWIHKKKRFKELDLQIILRCEFTRECFQVRMIANSIKRKEKLTEGIIMRTEPDPILFDGRYRDIELVGDKIVFTSRFTLFYYVDVADLQAGRFSVSVKGNKTFIDMLEDIGYAETTLVPEDEYIFDACELFKE